MNKKISLALSALIAVVGAIGFLQPLPAGAVPIQGQTPTGGVQAVGVSTNGYLFVQTSTMQATSVAIIESVPLTVKLSTAQPPGGILLNPVTIINPSVAVTGSSVTTSVTGQVTVFSSPSQIYPADTLRVQGVICNNDASIPMWFGNASVSPTTGMLLNPGACLSPDVPASMKGALFGVVKTSSVTISYVYFTP